MLRQSPSPARWDRERIRCIAYLPGNPAPAELHLQPVPLAQHHTVGDGLDFVGFTFPSPLPASLDDYVVKFDYNLTRDGNHRLFLKGIMDNERTAERNFVDSPNTVTGDGGEEFPGQPEGQVEHDNNKGITVGYTATFSSTADQQFPLRLYQPADQHSRLADPGLQ